MKIIRDFCMYQIPFLCFLLVSLSLIASENTSHPSTLTLTELFPKNDKTFPIQHMWPSDYIVKIPIIPAIPQDFVLKSAPNEIAPGYFVWGPKDVLDTYDFITPKPINKSIICFHISMDVAQTGPTSFSEVDRLVKGFKQMGVNDISFKTHMWGTYPVLQLRGTHQGKYIFAAWIGCNYSSNVIFARLMYPNNEDRPNKEDIQLWETFLSQTQPLPEPDNFIVQGFHMETGYTWMDFNNVRLLAVAERRRTDNLVQVTVIREDDTTSFSFLGIDNGSSGTKWRRGQEIVKIHANISKKLSEDTTIEMPSSVVNIFIKEVDEFSLDKKTIQNDPKTFVYQKTLEPITH